MANRILFLLLIFNLLIGSISAQLSDTSFAVFGDTKYTIKLATRATSPSQEENNVLLSLTVTDGNKNVKLLADSLFCQRTFIQWKDFNNDNIEDLLVFSATSARGNWIYYLYVVDAKNKTLHRVNGFEEIANPEFVSGDNVITSYTLTGKNFYSFYRIDRQYRLIDFHKSFECELDERDSIQYEKVMKEIRALRRSTPIRH